MRAVAVDARTDEHFQIAADRNLLNENLDVLLESQFAAIQRTAGTRVLTFGSQRHAGNEWGTLPGDMTTPIRRNIALLHSVRMEDLAGTIARIQAADPESGYPEGLDPGSLEVVVPIQVGGNHWVLAHLTPAAGRTPGEARYNLTYVDSLGGDLAARRAERQGNIDSLSRNIERQLQVLRSNRGATVRTSNGRGGLHNIPIADYIAQLEAERAHQTTILTSPTCHSDEYIQLIHTLEASGIQIENSLDLSCNQQGLARSENLGRGNAAGHVHDENFWSCGYITAENAVRLATTGRILSADQYTTGHKEQLFANAQRTLAAEARAGGFAAPVVHAIPVPAPHAAPQAAAKKKAVISLNDADLLTQKVDAIINPADVDMLLGSGASGLSGAIHTDIGANALAQAMHMAAGRPRINVGEAVTTTVADIAGRNRGSKIEKAGITHIIHAVGPDCRNPQQYAQRAQLLENAYENAFLAAKRAGVRTIGVPTISTGIFSFPKAEAAKIIAKVMKRHEQDFDAMKVCIKYDKKMLKLLGKELGIAKEESPAVKKAANTAAKKQKELQTELKKAQEEFEKKQLEIIEQEKKLASAITHAPFDVLDKVLTNLENGFKGLNLSNGTNALISVCTLLKSVLSIIPDTISSIAESSKKASAASEKKGESEKACEDLRKKILKLMRDVRKATIEARKEAAENKKPEEGKDKPKEGDGKHVKKEKERRDNKDRAAIGIS